MPGADDDALVAAAAVHHEVAETVGVDAVVIGAATGMGRSGKTAGGERQSQRQKTQLARFQTHCASSKDEAKPPRSDNVNAFLTFVKRQRRFGADAFPQHG
jgi:hypothetical protein